MPFTVETVSSSCLARSLPGFVTYTADFSGKYERVHFVTATDDGARRRLEVIHGVLREPPLWTSMGHFVRCGLEVRVNLEIQRGP